MSIHEETMITIQGDLVPDDKFLKLNFPIERFYLQDIDAGMNIVRAQRDVSCTILSVKLRNELSS